MSNGLDSDRDRHSVGPELANAQQKTKVAASKEKLKELGVLRKDVHVLGPIQSASSH